jgi:hypothetical protein
MWYNSLNNREYKGTGNACSFPQRFYPFQYEIDVIGVKKLLFLFNYVSQKMLQLSFYEFKMDISKYMATKLLILNSIGGVHVK